MEKKIIVFKEITEGRWSSEGNFLGKSSDGDIVHIYKKQLENMGFRNTISDNEKFTNRVELPLYILAYNKEFINRNNQNVVRLTAASVWKSYKELIEALLNENTLDAEIENEIEKRINEINGNE